MEDPMKVIHKYKNNNGRIQYHIYIFLGDIVEESCMKVLRKIKNVDLYNSLVTLDQKESEILIKNYGPFWYEKFFNSYHISFTKETTVKNPTKMKELQSIYGAEWISLHFVNYKKRIEVTTYSYATVVKEERERKIVKKIIQKQADEELIDYTTAGKHATSTLSRVVSKKKFENWCKDESSSDEECDDDSDGESDTNRGFESQTDSEYSESGSESESELDSDGYTTEPDEDDNSDEISEGGDEDEIIGRIPMRSNRSNLLDHKFIGGAAKGEENDELLNFPPDDPDYVTSDITLEDVDAVDAKTIEFETEVEQDLEDVDILFGELDDADKNIKLTTKEIKAAISLETYDKINKKILDFDSSKDNNMFDENLKDLYQKNYITNQYIFKDDTIKTIHNKICCAFKNNNKFGENTYIIPSYQYLWSEYLYKGQIEKVMIGQKWIVKNDILKLDTEPNTNLGVYEDLRGNLKNLRDNIRRLGKIKREDDDNNILFDYEGFYTYNELFMIDLYNELGLDYDPNFEDLKNLIDVYIKIYFPRVRPDDIRSIIDFLKKSNPESKKHAERNKLRAIFDTANNDLILENEIMRNIELVKKKNAKEYVKLFQENYVIQSVIRAYLLERNKKIDLFRIFDNFEIDETYPFIQYQPTDSTPRYRWNQKYLIENERKEIIMKWFENSPYGISFKVRINDGVEQKYTSINLSENGRIDYKIQWKEDEMHTVNDIDATHQYIRRLVEKINRENEKFPSNKLKVPADADFKFAFISTIQKFELPNNYVINHNDLSEFSRYFFPYIALVIDPRKRQSKVKKGNQAERSKFGTYLRYRRVSKYENKTKIEHRIIFFMRNYEYDDRSLSNEISKEFNITEEQALMEIVNVRDKYPNIKKSRRVLKKLENIPKYKPPGIGVDIQGKTRAKYKMRIAGARDKEQLDRIITFMNVLIYLYVDTYLYKKPDRQKMKDILKRLNKIAKRRNKVEEIVDYEIVTSKNVKQITAIDPKRLNYKADEDQNQWTRNCQNSGDDKKRRPQQFLNVEELLSLGYVWNDKLENFEYGHYERTFFIDSSGKLSDKKVGKAKQVTLRAVKLPLDDTGENFVYYTCGPEENGKHMYIGFLSKSKNPYGEPMPCCFIKDHLTSKNVEKRNFYLRSIGIIQDEEEPSKIPGDQLYILQDSNKIQEGRFAFLPKYLDILMNFMLDNERVIKNHYLLSTATGYYFKYGTKQNDFKYLNALCSVFDITIDELKKKLIKVLENDKHLVIFTSLNNGDIRSQFKTIDNYISYIRNNEYLEYPLLNDLICLPGVINKNGINVVIFQKKIKVIKKSLEREKVKENYFIVCQNQENIAELKNPLRQTALIIKESKNYYPIIMVKKDNEMDKDVTITKIFNYDQSPKNIINHIFSYYKMNCQSEFSILVKDKSVGSFNAKDTYQILIKLSKEFQPKSQIIDNRYKCKYLITHGGYIIPTIPSGTLYNLPIAANINNYIKDYVTTYKYLNEIADITNSKLRMKPVGIYYREKREKSYIISAIMTESYDSVPIVERTMTMEYIRKEKLIVQNKPNDDTIDKELAKTPKPRVIDNRIYYVSKNNYETELYQLFRLHLSYYLNNVPSGRQYKEKLEALINLSADRISKREKKLEIKRLLYSISSKDLFKMFNDLIKSKKNMDQSATLDAKPDKKSKKLRGGNLVPDTETSPSETSQFHVKETFITPDDYTTGHRLEKSPNDLDTPAGEFNYVEPTIPYNAGHEFIKNDPPDLDKVRYPVDEKNWLHVYPDNKKIDYPSIAISNNRDLCYNSNKDRCSYLKHCHWNSNKNMCMLGVKQNLLIDFINQVAEEFIQNEVKAHEILRKGEYFVSDIVNYNVFTERPGERVVVSSNTNINKILSEIFGKDNIPRIGKRRNKFDATQNYDQLKAEHPMKDFENFYIQPVIENNNTIFRAFANAYFWLMHPFNDAAYRNLGYYDKLQTDLSNIYKSQVVDWLLNPDNTPHINKLLPYIKYGKVIDFAIKLSSDVYTLTNCLIELYVLSKLYDTVIYVNNENLNVIYAFHPVQGFVYDYKIATEPFDISLYHSFKKIINLRFFYISKNIYPDIIEVMYPKFS